MSERGERRLLIRKKMRVLRDADHGEDLLKMSRKAKSVDLLAGVGCLDHRLDDKRDAAGVDVINLRKIKQNDLDSLLGEALVSADHGVARGAGDVAFKANDGNRMAGRGCKLVGTGTGFCLHCEFSLAINTVEKQPRLKATAKISVCEDG